MGVDEVGSGGDPLQRLLSVLENGAEAMGSLDLSAYSREELLALAESIDEILRAIDAVTVVISDDAGHRSAPLLLGDLLAMSDRLQLGLS